MLHLSWILSWLGPGASAQIGERWFIGLLGQLSGSAFDAAADLARRKACTFAFDPNTKTAIFQRVSSEGHRDRLV